jgi:GT2 family glycosyltransferase
MPQSEPRSVSVVDAQQLRMTAEDREVRDRDAGDRLCGPVGDLPPSPYGDYDPAHLAALSRPFDGRPTPNDTETITTPDYHLFSSMSFAISVRSWERLGGFHPGYQGYGAEDTDFGQQAKAAGIALRWVGGAWAHHQYHPKNDPPAEHLHDIVIWPPRWAADSV